MAIAGQLLIEIGANVARLQHDLSNAQKQIGGFVRDAQSLFGSLGAIVGIGSIGSVFSSIIKAAAEAEVQEQKLAAALRSRGIVQREVTEALLDYSKKLQANTIFSDEQINAAMRFATSLGVLPSQMKQVIDMAVKIAVLYDKDLTESVTAITKAMAGSGKGFRDIDTDIAQLIPTIQTADERFKILNERFSGDALKDLDTYTGRVKQFQNQWDEFKEAAGNAFIPALKGILWHMTQILKTPQKYLPGEFNFYDDDAFEEDKKNFDDILKEADKSFKKSRKRDPKAEKYAQAMEDINKKIKKVELEAAYTGHELKKQLMEIELEHYKKMGISREKFDELISKTAAAEDFKYRIESWQRYNESVQQSNAKLRELFRQGALDDAKLEADLIEQNRILREAAITGAIALQQELVSQLQSQLSTLGADKLGGLIKTLSDIQTGQDVYSRREASLQEHYQRMQQLADEGSASQAQADDAYREYTLAQDEKVAQQRMMIMQNMAGTLSQTFANLYTALGQKAKIFFHLSKAFAIAETILNTEMAAMASYFWGAKFGGPALGAAFAAIAYAAGMARIATIMATKPA